MSAGSILPLKPSISASPFLAPFSMAFLICASVFAFCQAAAVMSSTFSFWPWSVCPLPSAPWQEAHFPFHARATFGSVSARAVAAQSSPTSSSFEWVRMDDFSS
jgi:hypothetical protein